MFNLSPLSGASLPAAFTLGGQRVLIENQLQPATLYIDSGYIAEITPGLTGPLDVNAGELTVLPGIVDLHGDAFERDLQPRPGVDMPVDLALISADRQIVSHGITTAFYGITYSWEPGLRDGERLRALLAAMDRIGPTLGADARVHLRWETYNVDAVGEVVAILRSGQVHLLAFNDHTGLIYKDCDDPVRLGRMSMRTGMDVQAFAALARSVVAREAEVPEAVRTLARVARESGVAMASHDDESAETCRYYHDLGCRVSDFPVTMDAAEAALAQQMTVVLGAPNVVRGGSHLRVKGISAADAVLSGHCAALASDYYYPTMLLAPYRLVERGLDFGAAWHCVSAGPARGAGLTDRGELAVGQRADFIVVADRPSMPPRVMTTFVQGKPVFQMGL